MFRPPTFFTSLFAALGGSALTVIEFLQGASLFLGCVGACLAIAGGWYAFRIKRHEWQLLERRAASRRPRD